MSKVIKSHIAAFTSFILAFFTLVPVTQAFTFEPLSGDLPVIGQNWPGMQQVLNALLAMSVGLAAILAVIMLAIGGFKYMTTDSVFRMGGAKEQIANAIVGLLIVLAAVLVLDTINPNLVSMNAFNGL